MNNANWSQIRKIVTQTELRREAWKLEQANFLRIIDYAEANSIEPIDISKFSIAKFLMILNGVNDQIANACPAGVNALCRMADLLQYNQLQLALKTNPEEIHFTPIHVGGEKLNAVFLRSDQLLRIMQITEPYYEFIGSRQ
jgi:hypothetical protein